MKFCAHCGRQLEQLVRFCPNCGASIPQTQPQNVAQNQVIGNANNANSVGNQGANSNLNSAGFGNNGFNSGFGNGNNNGSNGFNPNNNGFNPNNNGFNPNNNGFNPNNNGFNQPNSGFNQGNGGFNQPNANRMPPPAPKRALKSHNATNTIAVISIIFSVILLMSYFLTDVVRIGVVMALMFYFGLLLSTLSLARVLDPRYVKQPKTTALSVVAFVLSLILIFI